MLKLVFVVALISATILMYSGFGTLNHYFCAKVDCAYQVFEELKLADTDLYKIGLNYKYKLINRRETTVLDASDFILSAYTNRYSYSKLLIPNFELEVKKWQSDPSLDVKIKTDKLFGKGGEMENYEKFLPDWFEARHHFARIVFLNPDTKNSNGWIDIYHEPNADYAYVIMDRL